MRMPCPGSRHAAEHAGSQAWHSDTAIEWVLMLGLVFHILIWTSPEDGAASTRKRRNKNQNVGLVFVVCSWPRKRLPMPIPAKMPHLSEGWLASAPPSKRAAASLSGAVFLALDLQPRNPSAIALIARLALQIAQANS